MSLSQNLSVSIPKYNARIKQYPDGSQEILVCSKQIFNPENLESPYSDYEDFSEDKKKKSPCDALDSRAIRRAKKNIKDYILCNNFEYFITLTLDKRNVSRDNYKEIIIKMNTWLDNNVRRKGLQYLIVPEFHKNGSIHFHGLINESLEMLDSGTVSVKGLKKPIKISTYKRYYPGKEYQTVYNIPGWKYGFSTAIQLYGDKRAVANYIGKYLEKDFQKVGGRYYLHSNNLSQPTVVYSWADFSQFPGEPFNFNEINIFWKIQYVNKNINI